MKRRYRAIGNPTKAEQAHQDAQRLRQNRLQAGVTEVHHRTCGDMHGQKQLGQDQVVSLCAWHHDGVQILGQTIEQMRQAYGPSFKHHARDFRIWTDDAIGGRGTEAWQRYQDELLGLQEAA
jgi:hypothetical protein